MATGPTSETPSEPTAPGLEAVAARIGAARGLAHAGAELPAETRLRGPKAAILAVMRPVTSIQRRCNDATLDAVDGVRAEVVQQEGALAGLRATVTLTDAAVDDAARQLDELRAEVAALRAEVAALRSGAPTTR